MVLIDLRDPCSRDLPVRATGTQGLNTVRGDRCNMMKNSCALYFSAHCVAWLFLRLASKSIARLTVKYLERQWNKDHVNRVGLCGGMNF